MNTEKSTDGLYEWKGEVSPEDILEMHCPDLKHRQPLFYNGALAALKEYASRAIIDFCNKIQDQPPSEIVDKLVEIGNDLAELVQYYEKRSYRIGAAKKSNKAITDWESALTAYQEWKGNN